LLQAHGSGSCSGSPLRLCSSARVSQSRASHRGRKRTGRAGGAHPRLRIVRRAGGQSPVPASNSSIRMKAATKRFFRIPARIRNETCKGSIQQVGPTLGMAHPCIPPRA
jgi:hypothetical protein